MKSKDNTYRPADVFDQFVKEVFGKSPFEEVKELETIKHKREKQNEK